MEGTVFKLEEIRNVSFCFNIKSPNTVQKKQLRKKSDIFSSDTFFDGKDTMILENNRDDELLTAGKRFNTFFYDHVSKSDESESDHVNESYLNFDEDKSILSIKNMHSSATCLDLEKSEAKEANNVQKEEIKEEVQAKKKRVVNLKRRNELSKMNTFSEAYRNMVMMKKKGHIHSPKIEKKKDKLKISVHLRRKLEKVKYFWEQRKSFLPSTFKMIKMQANQETDLIEFRDFSMKGLKNENFDSNNNTEEKKDSTACNDANSFL